MRTSVVRTVHARRRGALLLLSLSLCALASGAVRGARARQRPDGGERKVAVRPAVGELPARPKRYALVVGVDSYADAQIGGLAGAANDARLLAAALVERAGFPAEQVVLLASGEPPERQPTRGQILRRLSNLAGAVPPDGLLLFSFAGHGVERGGRAFLLPSDAQLNGDVELLEQTAVGADWVRKRIEAAGVRQVLMLLDACRDDPAAGRSAAGGALTETYRRAFNLELRNRGVEAFATIYATAVGGRAYEYREKRHGYFTWALVEGLRGGAADARGEVTLAGLVKYVQEYVPRRVALDLGPGLDQRPFADVSGYRADELVIAAAAGGPAPPPDREATADVGPSANAKAAEAKPPQPAPPVPSPGAGSRKSEEELRPVLLLTLYMMGAGDLSDRADPPQREKVGVGFWLPLSRRLADEGVSTTAGWELRRAQHLYTFVSELEEGRRSTSRRLRYSVIVVRAFTVRPLDPHDGLHAAEVSGFIKAFDSDTGRVVAHQGIAYVRGFGTNEAQARENALAAAGEKVSKEFIAQVAAAAR
ncbi:MAG TPA: caspase family protein, partial [Pyrinomonadaceae bacterium]